MPTDSKGTPQAITLGSENGVKKDFRQLCKYGKDCYQKNPMHHQKFRHPKDEEKENKKSDEKEETIETPLEEPPAKKLRVESDSDNEEPVVKESPKDLDDIDCAKVSKSPQVFDSNEKGSDYPCEKETPIQVDDNSDLVPAFKDWPSDPIKSVEQKFLTKMPDDFMAFWEMCKTIDRENPREALLKSCGLLLVGPYDIIAGQEFKSDKLNDYLCHYRFYRDPPEFQTVIVSVEEDSNFHFGYFRDDPKEVPVFVAAYGGKENTSDYNNYKFTLYGDNLFAAVYLYIGQLINKVDPFKMTSLQKLKGSVHVHATMKNQDQSFNLEAKSTSMKSRDKKKVAATFHQAGLVVPYNKSTQVGYREIPETNASLKKILGKIVETQKEDADEHAKNKAFDALQELVTNVQFANDEGDPGMGLELGIDVLMFGGDCLNSAARHLLTVSYDLIDRDAFAKITNAHLNRRREKRKFFKAI